MAKKKKAKDEVSQSSLPKASVRPPLSPEVLLPEDDSSSQAASLGLAAQDGSLSGTISRPSSAATGPIVDVTSASAAITNKSLSMPLSRSGASVTKVGPLQAYMKTIGQYPVLSAEDERALALRVYEHQDKRAAQALAVHNLRLVVKMAYKYRRAWANMLDLIQEGNIGLLEAVKRYDPFKGARFSTYAAFWIRAYLLRFILEHSRNVKVARTRAGRKLFFRLGKERAKLQALGIEAGPKLLAEKIGISEKDFHEVVPLLDQAEVRLDLPINPDSRGGASMLDILRSAERSPESAAHDKAFSADVNAAFDSFALTLKDDRERAIWSGHMTAEDPVSLSKLGVRFGVSKQRMGQIVAALRKRLKTHLLEEMGAEVEMEFKLSTKD
jgi:RNA polymerase sigma-32 factor